MFYISAIVIHQHNYESSIMMYFDSIQISIVIVFGTSLRLNALPGRYSSHIFL